MKRFNHAVQEGIVFLLAGAALLYYALTSYAKAFNKDWAQSPYLFPLMVACAFIVLALSLLRRGMAADAPGEGAGQPGGVDDIKQNPMGVAVIIVLCLIYYAALKYLLIPYVTFGVLSFSFTISTFEIVTWVFLIIMMAYMGVRNIPVLIFVPFGASLFLSIAFRNLLNVLLP